VTQLEVTPQNVKQPKNGRNSGHVRNSGDYGTFFVAINFTKLKIILFLECRRKRILANFQRIIELFTKKLSLSSQKYGFGIRDPGSGKNPFRIPDQKGIGTKGTIGKFEIVNLQKREIIQK
jgi:hypothetical protein